MARNPIQDVVIPTKKRSIRQIERTPRPSSVEEGTPVDLPPPPPQPQERPRRLPSFGGGIGLWVAAGIIVVALGFALSLLFSGTSVTVIPKQSTVSVDTALRAFKTAKPGELPFQTMTIEKTASQSVPSTGQEDATLRASGKIVIYNNYSAAPQRLIRNTRFESSGGKIYRIDASIVVPGKTATAPGDIEVEVFADEPGEAYNIGLSDFTIPGFKGTAQYSKFYARSKTPMTGGFVGKRLTIDPVVLSKAKDDIHAKLNADLITAVDAQKPEGYELYEGAIFFEYTSMPNAESGSAVLVTEKATLYGVLFDKKELASAVASAMATTPASGVPLLLADDSTLAFAVAEQDRYHPWEKESFSFTLKGTAHLVAEFNEGDLRGDLVGKSRAGLPTILSGYPGIERAEVVMRPFWKRSFPENPEDIELKISLGQGGN